MKNREYPPIGQLRKEFSANKQIPPKYEEPILKALSHYPELRETHIRFVLKNNSSLPYHTLPSLSSLIAFRPRYSVYLLEEAKPRMEQALFRNLPEAAQVGVIAHELGHVLQYSGKKFRQVIAGFAGASRGALQRDMERGADIHAIEHGLGFELYTHAVYIRSIKGYVEERKDIDVCYLHPNEILEALPAEQLHEIHRSL